MLFAVNNGAKVGQRAILSPIIISDLLFFENT